LNELAREQVERITGMTTTHLNELVNKHPHISPAKFFLKPESWICTNICHYWSLYY